MSVCQSWSHLCLEHDSQLSINERIKVIYYDWTVEIRIIASTTYHSSRIRGPSHKEIGYHLSSFVNSPRFCIRKLKAKQTEKNGKMCHAFCLLPRCHGNLSVHSTRAMTYGGELMDESGFHRSNKSDGNSSVQERPHAWLSSTGPNQCLDSVSWQ